MFEADETFFVLPVAPLRTTLRPTLTEVRCGLIVYRDEFVIDSGSVTVSTICINLRPQLGW